MLRCDRCVFERTNGKGVRRLAIGNCVSSIYIIVIRFTRLRCWQPCTRLECVYMFFFLTENINIYQFSNIHSNRWTTAQQSINTHNFSAVFLLFAYIEVNRFWLQHDFQPPKRFDCYDCEIHSFVFFTCNIDNQSVCVYACLVKITENGQQIGICREKCLCLVTIVKLSIKKKIVCEKLVRAS